MSVNSSSSLNSTLVPPSLPSPLLVDCLKSVASRVIFTIYTVTNALLLLPLYILILRMGFRRWRTQRSVPAGQPPSHSDFFAYHIVAVEVLGVSGCLAYALGMYTDNATMLMSGMFVSCVIFPGQSLFHCLTCVERHLAAVHPVTYMRLRESGGVRIRNVSIACVWLMCFGWVGVTKVYLPEFPVVPLLCMTGVTVIVIFFCCLSVLRVLTHSGPGEVGGNKERVDQSKQRAFRVICAIMGVLLLRFVGLLASFGVSYKGSISQQDVRAVMNAGILFTVPSSLVVPLLFLHKAGKLACCRRSAGSQ